MLTKLEVGVEGVFESSALAGAVTGASADNKAEAFAILHAVNRLSVSVGAHGLRVAAVRAKTRRCREVQLRAGCVNQVVKLNAIRLAFMSWIGVFELYLRTRVIFRALRVDVVSGRLAEIDAVLFVKRAKFEDHLFTRH